MAHGGGPSKSRNYILEKIESHFGDAVVVFWSSGFSKILCFKGETTKLLHLAKQEEQDMDNLEMALKRLHKLLRKRPNTSKLSVTAIPLTLIGIW